MEESLERITETWELLYKEFEESGEEVIIYSPELLCPVITAGNKTFKYYSFI